MEYTDNLSQFGLSTENGFLPLTDPIVTLPEGWDYLDDFGRNLPGIAAEGRIKEAAEKLPVPSEKELSSLNTLEKHRAMLIYGFGASAYVHGQGKPVSMLCANLARPLCWLSNVFEKPPILSYCSYALHNWRRLDARREIVVDNLDLLQNFIELRDEDWFILIHIDIEKKAAPAIAAISRAVKASLDEDDVALVRSLQAVVHSLDDMITTLKRMPEGCSSEVYYMTVRPWIMFFDNVIYQGVPELGSKPQQFRGETGAQSSIMPLLEAGLQIRHQESILTRHLREMRHYMLKQHRSFIEQIEQASQVRDFVIALNRPSCKELYNGCLEKMFEFRDIHFGYAAVYIHQKTTNNLGTGGTVFMPWLEQLRNETRSQLLA